MIAGADTVTTTLTYTLYFLLAQPHYLRRLRAEVDSVFDENKVLDTTSFSRLPFLNACLNETLRLVPGTPSGGQRSVDASGGLVICNEVIPEGTALTIVRLVSYF